MNRTRSRSAEFPLSKQSQDVTFVKSDDALFGVEPATAQDSIPDSPFNPAPDKAGSQAWADLGSRELFELPRGLDRDSLNAIHAMSPNKQTERAIRRDNLNEHYGLTGDVKLTDEQLDNLRAAARQGQPDRIARRIQEGMSEQEVVAREMIRASRLGKDPSEISL